MSFLFEDCLIVCCELVEREFCPYVKDLYWYYVDFFHVGGKKSAHVDGFTSSD